MLAFIRRVLCIATGERFINVLEESKDRLTIQSLGCTTMLDRRTQSISQYGRRMVSIDAVTDIHLSQPMNSEGPPNWSIALRLQDGQRIELGTITDSTDASLIAAKLATATNKPVRI